MKRSLKTTKDSKKEPEFSSGPDTALQVCDPCETCISGPWLPVRKRWGWMGRQLRFFQVLTGYGSVTVVYSGGKKAHTVSYSQVLNVQIP